MSHRRDNSRVDRAWRRLFRQPKMTLKIITVRRPLCDMTITQMEHEAAQIRALHMRDVRTKLLYDLFASDVDAPDFVALAQQICRVTDLTNDTETAAHE